MSLGCVRLQRVAEGFDEVEGVSEFEPHSKKCGLIEQRTVIRVHACLQFIVDHVLLVVPFVLIDHECTRLVQAECFQRGVGGEGPCTPTYPQSEIDRAADLVGGIVGQAHGVDERNEGDPLRVVIVEMKCVGLSILPRYPDVAFPIHDLRGEGDPK